MAIGPVQLIVLGFDEPEFKGEVLAELDRPVEGAVDIGLFELARRVHRLARVHRPAHPVD